MWNEEHEDIIYDGGRGGSSKPNEDASRKTLKVLLRLSPDSCP